MNLQFLVNVVDFGMDIQEAIDAPVVEKLMELGHQTRPAGDWSLGDTTALMVDPKRGVLFGAASPRRDKSYALAW